jgi:uncharacterized membrane protein YfcA
MLACIVAAAIYCGYFGAGAGIMMLAAFLVLGKLELRSANALKNTLGGVTTIAPAILFAFAGHVVWAAAASLAAGALAGGAIGPAIARRTPDRPLRRGICVCGLVLAGYLVVNAAG